MEVKYSDEQMHKAEIERIGKLSVEKMRDFDILYWLSDRLNLPWPLMDMSLLEISRAEMALQRELRYEYVMILSEAIPQVDGWFGVITATPRQRAEAMVRCLGGEEGLE